MSLKCDYVSFLSFLVKAVFDVTNRISNTFQWLYYSLPSFTKLSMNVMSSEDIPTLYS